MGIVNVTPDSFSDGGLFRTVSDAAAYALGLAQQGADILDIGGESTRPGSFPVSSAEELERILPVISRLAGKTSARICIDTRKPAVAMAAVGAGASIWNDVSALGYAPESLETASSLDCDIIIMHACGDPRTMQDNPRYENVVEDVYAFLSGRVETCVAHGINADRLIIDPGIGFGKSVKHNMKLIAGLERLLEIGRPVLLGASRKRFISAIDRDMQPRERIGGSIASVLAGFDRGASIFRVHDVEVTRQALNVHAALNHDK